MQTHEIPTYRLITPFFTHPECQYVEEGAEIEFDGTPNENMQPLNEAARIKMVAYLHTLEGGKRTPDLGDIVARQIASRPKHEEITSPELKALIALAEGKAQNGAPEDAVSTTRVLMPEYNPEVPLMTGSKEQENEARRGRKPSVRVTRGANDAVTRPKRKRIMTYTSGATTDEQAGAGEDPSY